MLKNFFLSVWLGLCSVSCYAQTWPITQDTLPLYIFMGNTVYLSDYAGGVDLKDPQVSCSQGSVLKGRDSLELKLFPRDSGQYILYVKDRGDTVAQVHYKALRISDTSREVEVRIGQKKVLENPIRVARFPVSLRIGAILQPWEKQRLGRYTYSGPAKYVMAYYRGGRHIRTSRIDFIRGNSIYMPALLKDIKPQSGDKIWVQVDQVGICTHGCNWDATFKTKKEITLVLK